MFEWRNTSNCREGCFTDDAGERLNGIQEVSGSIPLISTISRERTFPRFRKEARFCFLCGNSHDVQPVAELLKVDIEINVQLVVPVDIHPLD